MDYEIYRDGASKLRNHLQASIQAFYGRHGRLPVSVIVSKSKTSQKDEGEQTLEEKAKVALENLELPDLPVKTTGGCLAGEIWLEVGEEVANGNVECVA
jgi:hypothetical protein